MKANLLGKHLYINLKSIFTSKVNIFIIVGISLMMILLPMFLFPLLLSYSLIVTATIVVCCSVVFISTFINVSDTLMDKNNNSYNRYVMNYLLSILTMLIVSLFSFLIIFFGLVIVNQFDLLLVDWFTHSNNQPGDYKYVFNIQLFVISIYCVLLTVGVTFSISALVFLFTNDVKTYTIIICSLLILIILFGGTINSYWWPTGDSSLFGQYGGGLYRMQDSIFPWSIYFVSGLFPYFSIGSKLNVTMALSRAILVSVDGVVTTPDIFVNGSTTFFDIDPITGNQYHKTMFAMFSFNNDPLWVLLLWIPYIEIVIIVTILISRSFIVSKL